MRFSGPLTARFCSSLASDSHFKQLKQRLIGASRHQEWHGGLSEVQLEGSQSAMSLAAAISGPQVVSKLLGARAAVDSTDGLGRLYRDT